MEQTRTDSSFINQPESDTHQTITADAPDQGPQENQNDSDAHPEKNDDQLFLTHVDYKKVLKEENVHIKDSTQYAVELLVLPSRPGGSSYIQTCPFALGSPKKRKLDLNPHLKVIQSEASRRKQTLASLKKEIRAADKNLARERLHRQGREKADAIGRARRRKIVARQVYC